MVRNIVVIILSVLMIKCIAQSQSGTSTDFDDLIAKIFPDLAPTPTPTTTTTSSSTPTPSTVSVFNTTPKIPLSQQPEFGEYKSCGFQKECVPYYLCNNDNIVKDGTAIIDIRSDRDDCSYLEICCNVPDKTTEPVIVIPPREQHAGCGFRNPDGVGFKITGDNNSESQFGEFPWMVAILREEEILGSIINLYECGGSLIAPTVIMTTSHCVQTLIASTIFVRAGEWDTQTTSELLPHQNQRVKEIIMHEQYNKGSLHYDIALLILASPMTLVDNVQPICLPDTNVNFDFTRCYATGWGKDKFGRNAKYQEILKKIEIPIVPKEQCQLNLRKTRLGYRFRLHDSFICAGGEEDTDTCKGDGGSPLVCAVPGVKNRFYQAGIVAWGIGCGEVNIPGVYVNVAFLRPWINEKLISRGIDFKYFTA